MRDEPRSETDLPLTPPDFIWTVGSLCNLRRRLFDAALVQREFPPPHSAASVVEALRSLELAVHLAPLDRRELTKLSLPRLVFMRPVPNAAPVDPDAMRAKVAATPTSAVMPALLAK